MARPDICFIGDEVTAAGFRMAGLRTLVPRSGAEAECLAAARETAGLIYLAAEVAGRIPGAALDVALRDAAPPVLIVPDLNGRVAPPDMERRILGLLGLET
jgi:vacuolar-type H+-ATPase subunit F/Vma7